MVTIEPYKFIEQTNLSEHNMIVDKINELVDSVNDIATEPLKPIVDQLIFYVGKDTDLIPNYPFNQN